MLPLLWDKKTNYIVNNESSEIVLMFNKKFDSLLQSSLEQGSTSSRPLNRLSNYKLNSSTKKRELDLCPKALQP